MQTRRSDSYVHLMDLKTRESFFAIEFVDESTGKTVALIPLNSDLSDRKIEEIATIVESALNKRK